MRIENLIVEYEDEDALKGVDLAIDTGEILGIAGESGSGKSTLLKTCAGMIRHDLGIRDGDIFFRGRSYREMGEKEFGQLRGRRIGMVFQNSKESLCPVRKIGKQIVDYALSHEKGSKRAVMERAASLLNKMGIKDPERVLNSYPHELSGGMNGRVGILMGMFFSPDLLLADEITASLDEVTQEQVLNELLNLQKEMNTAVLFVTHNLNVLSRIAHRTALMKEGRIVEYGRTEEVVKKLGQTASVF